MIPMRTVVPPEVRQRIRGPWVDVDLGILADNIQRMQAALRPPSTIMFIVKADAYGHGMVPVAKRAAAAGVRWFGVAYLAEAVAVREVVPEAQIVVMGVVDPADAPQLAAYNITPVVVSEQHGLDLAQAARAARATLPVHLKVDTGMNRLGVPWEEGASVLQRLSHEPGIEVTGLCSHFATVEPDREDLAEAQYERFAGIAAGAPSTLFRHISSSRAFLYYPEWDFEAVRIGIALYGYGTSEIDMRVQCRPVLQWKTTVTQVKPAPAGSSVGYYGTYVTRRPTRLATLAIGYADGYLRTLSNRGHVLIRGRRCKVVGRVSMNWLTVDVGLESDVVPGDEAVLIGEQGGEAVWADELAAQCRTIAYEILTGINPTLERKYRG